jgi:hypothetical protein
LLVLGVQNFANVNNPFNKFPKGVLNIEQAALGCQLFLNLALELASSIVK